VKFPRRLTNKKLLPLLLLGCGSVWAQAQDTLWINAGTWSPQGTEWPALRLNSSPVFTLKNSVLQRLENESSTLVVVNTDNDAHTFAAWAEEAFLEEEIPAGATAEIDLPSLEAGTYGCGLEDDLGRWHGARSLMAVASPADTLPTFFWNLSEWDTERMSSIAAGGTPSDFGPYVPQYFTINEAMHPQTLADPTALVSLPLNSAAIIRVHNAGAMDHVLHFHGFHVEILSSTHHPERVGWSKDTQPLKVGEGLTFRLFADQTGIYPVHDHNLIAVTNAGLYPGGMLTQIHVTE
jgi:FtsP/CotA-like multicopper oxidase with cupredoxin domain